MIEFRRPSLARAYQIRHDSASTVRAIRRARRPRYGTISAPVQVQPVAAAFAVVVDVFDFHRSPSGEFEIVRNDASALFELLFENGSYFIVRHRQQVYGQKIGRRIVLL